MFDLPYMEMLKRCDETERKLQYLSDRCEHLYLKQQPAGSIEEMQHLLLEMAKAKNKDRDLLFDEIA